jgi:echinoderm microtubule-associated protein-like 1/2
VLEDLGQVLKMNGAKKMFTINGQEVRSFSQLRNEFNEVDTFYLSTGASGPVGMPPSNSPVRRSRSRASMAAPPMPGIGGPVPGPVVAGTGVIGAADDTSKAAVRQRARSKSRPRILYAPENELVRASGTGEYRVWCMLKFCFHLF